MSSPGVAGGRGEWERVTEEGGGQKEKTSKGYGRECKRPCLGQEKEIRRKEEKIDKQGFKNPVDTPETSQQAE